jgi:hypothetical protein
MNKLRGNDFAFIASYGILVVDSRKFAAIEYLCTGVSGASELASNEFATVSRSFRDPYLRAKAQPTTGLREELLYG